MITWYLFGLIVGAIVISNVFMIPVFAALDWSNIQTLTEALRVILFWVIGIEFARLLIAYRTEIVIELLVFVLARKLLLIEDDVPMVALGSVVILALIVARQYLFQLDRRSRDAADEAPAPKGSPHQD